MKKNTFLLISILLCSFTITYSQQSRSVTTVPPLTSNSTGGSNGVSFNVSAKNHPVIIDSIYKVFDKTTAQSVTIWVNTDSINGQPTVNAVNGWINMGTVNVTPLGTGNTLTPIPLSLNVPIPAGGTYGFYFESSDAGFHQFKNGDPDLFSDNNISINTASYCGFSGSVPTPSQDSSQFTGKVIYHLDYDVAILKIDSPITACSLTTKEPVIIEIQNNGRDLSNISFDVSYTVNGGLPQTDNITFTQFLTDSIKTYTFSTPVNLSVPGLYNIEVSANLTQDVYAGNDNTKKRVNSFSTTKAVASSNSPICEGDTLKLTGKGLGTFQWTGPNGFSTNKQDTNISNTTLLDSGIYVLTVTNACGTDTDSISVTILPFASVTVSSNSPLCVGDSLELHATGNGAFSWTGPNGFTSSSKDTGIGNITLADTGNYSVVVTNGSCSDTESVSITINATAPIAKANSNGPLCEGDTLKLESQSTDGIQFNWTGPNGFISNSEDTLITNVTVSDSGNYIITVSNGCGTDTDTVAVNINKIPTALASSNSPLCVGDTLKLQASGGGTYSWTAPSGGSGPGPNITIPNISSADSGIYVLEVTDNGCTDKDSINVIINSNPPIITSISSNTPICEGDSLKLNSTSQNGITYHWTGSNSFSSNGQDTLITNSNLSDSGYYKMVVTNACGSDTDSVNVTIYPFTKVVASSNSPLCEGDTLKLQTTGSGTYTWNGPNGFSSSSQNPTIPNVTQAHSGIYIITVTSNNGCMGIDTVNVAVNAPTSVTASSNSPICEGDALKLTANGSGGTYSWTGPNGFSSSSQNPIINNVTQNASGTYQVIASANGCIDSSSIKVTVYPGVIADAGKDTTIKAGETITLNGSGGGSYLWNPSDGLNNKNAQNPTASPNKTTHYTLLVTSSNGCQDTAGVTITVINDFVISDLITANGDGYNDKWVITNITSYKNNEVSVLNRYGQEVFSTSNYQNNWKGTYGGKTLPDGAYYYIIKLGNGKVFKGTLSIISGSK